MREGAFKRKRTCSKVGTPAHTPPASWWRACAAQLPQLITCNTHLAPTPSITWRCATRQPPAPGWAMRSKTHHPTPGGVNKKLLMGSTSSLKNISFFNPKEYDFGWWNLKKKYIPMEWNSHEGVEVVARLTHHSRIQVQKMLAIRSQALVGNIRNICVARTHKKGQIRSSGSGCRTLSSLFGHRIAICCRRHNHLSPGSAVTISCRACELVKSFFFLSLSVQEHFFSPAQTIIVSSCSCAERHVLHFLIRIRSWLISSTFCEFYGRFDRGCERTPNVAQRNDVRRGNFNHSG